MTRGANGTGVRRKGGTAIRSTPAAAATASSSSPIELDDSTTSSSDDEPSDDTDDDDYNDDPHKENASSSSGAATTTTMTTRSKAHMSGKMRAAMPWSKETKAANIVWSTYAYDSEPVRKQKYTIWHTCMIAACMIYYDMV